MPSGTRYISKIDPRAGLDVESRFAAAAGIDKTTYSLMKKGERDLPFTAACRIRDRWGVSLDWLYYGEQPAGAQLMAKIGRGPVSAVAPTAKKQKQAQPARRAHPKRKAG